MERNVHDMAEYEKKPYSSESEIEVYKGIVLRRDERTLCFFDRNLFLEAKEFYVMELLMVNAESAMSKEEIERSVQMKDIRLSQTELRRRIRFLRRKLLMLGARHVNIQTINQIGYILKETKRK